MELKVWVEGIQRVVCGVSDLTTCQDVVIALAHATGKTGRFTLVEKWRENERLLSPAEQPVKVLQKWGEYATDVHFVLRHSSVRGKAERPGRRGPAGDKHLLPHSRFEVRQGSGVKRNLTFSGARPQFNHHAPKHHKKPPSGVQQNSSLESLDERSSFSSRSTMSPYASFDKRQQRAQPYPPVLNHHGAKTAIVHSPQSSYGSTCSPKSDSTPFSSLERQKGRPTPVPLVPPHNNLCKPPGVVRDATPALAKTVPVKGPRIHIEEYNLDLNLLPASKHHAAKGLQISPKNFKQDSGIGDSPPNEHIDCRAGLPPGSTKEPDAARRAEFKEKVTHADDVSKEELIKLVNLQLEKLESQESIIAKLNSEVSLLEREEDEHNARHRTVQAEIARLTAAELDYDNELEELELVSWEDKLELERHRLDTLRSEITLCRTRVDSKELELIGTKRREETLVDEMEAKKTGELRARAAARDAELDARRDAADVQQQINRKLAEHERNAESVGELLSEVHQLESEIVDRQTQIAGLEKDLLQANMEQFKVTPTDCLRAREGRPFDRNSPSRPGSARKMTQSPQRLREAVPTLKDPHGLWV